MITNTGYRLMIRDRIPRLVNLALKWCKCKEKWLDHVYRNWIWMYSSKDMRNNATRDLLGLDKHGKPTNFKFEDTILWDNLTDEETNYWKSVCSWVSWFCKQYSYVENEYTVSLKVGKNITEIKLAIMQNYLGWLCPTSEDSAKTRKEKNKKINLFVDFLIDCFENRIK